MAHDVRPLRLPSLGPAGVGEAGVLSRLSGRLIEAGLRPRWTEPAIASQIRDPDTEVVAARRGRRIVGFAVMHYDFERERAHLVLLAVTPEERRAGLGGSLYEWVERMARRAGVHRVDLELRATNAGARAFYEQLGFHDRAARRRYYDGREDAVVMTRSLRRSP